MIKPVLIPSRNPFWLYNLMKGINISYHLKQQEKRKSCERNTAEAILLTALKPVDVKK